MCESAELRIDGRANAGRKIYKVFKSGLGRYLSAPVAGRQAQTIKNRRRTIVLPLGGCDGRLGGRDSQREAFRYEDARPTANGPTGVGLPGNPARWVALALKYWGWDPPPGSPVAMVVGAFELLQRGKPANESQQTARRPGALAASAEKQTQYLS